MGADDFGTTSWASFFEVLERGGNSYADELLRPDGLTYMQLKEGTGQGDEYLAAIRGEALDKLGYFLKPTELFGELARREMGGKSSSY